jgi:hypothetical protein
MPINDTAEREYREELKRLWAKMRAKARVRAEAKAKRTPRARPRRDQNQTRKQVAVRVQRAAGEALAALKRRQIQEGQS